jgi:hypothetical protein
LALAAPLLATSLFLSRDRYVNIRLELTFQTAYRGAPGFWH